MNAIISMFKTSPSNEDRSSDAMEGGRRKGETDNPYLSARRTWNDYTGSIIAARRMWQAVAVVSLMIVLVTIGGLISVAGKSKFVPYVIEVDKLGNAIASGPISSTTKADPRILKSTVAEFITDSRLVTPDIALQRSSIFRIYARLASNDPATQKMNEWLNGTADSTPFKRATKVMVSIEIKSVMPQTPDTWQVDWVETTRDRNGGLANTPKTYRALVTVYMAEPSSDTTEEQLRMNPLGIYVSDFSWQVLL